MRGIFFARIMVFLLLLFINIKMNNEMVCMMKKIIATLLLVGGMTHAQENQTPDNQTIKVTAQRREKMKLLLGVVQVTPELDAVMAQLKKDLEFTQQFDVAVEHFDAIPSKQKDIKALHEQGHPIAIFVNPSGKQMVEWRLYDTRHAQMMAGKKYTKQGDVVRGWAHNIADGMWQALTSQPGFFSTKIAYSKKVTRPKKSSVKHICIADYDGSNEQVLIKTPTINVAPRWNHDKNHPLLFYSEGTNTNMRMMVADMTGRRKIASNFDGLNMLPSFSKDGKQAVYCASRGDGSCQIYNFSHGILKKLTRNFGNNVSPSLGSSGTVLYYCSDYETGKPQIYTYNLQTHEQTRITDGGYCAAPAYHEESGRVVYSKLVDGLMQIMVYNEKTGQHTQLTHDGGSKQECAWSECGNYILFSYEIGQQSSIALLNLVTHHRHLLTDAKQICSYPAWSSTFNSFPVVAA